MADSQDKQKEQADAKGRGCIDSYEAGDQVLLNARKLPKNVVFAVFKTKLRLRFIGPFTVIAKKGLAYTLNLPRKLRTHPVLYVGLLKPYHGPSLVDRTALEPEGGTSSPPAASSSSASPVHPAVAGCTPPSTVACRTSRSNRDVSSAHATEPTQSMTVHERVALGRGSPGFVSSQSQTDPVPSARERKILGVASPLTPSFMSLCRHSDPPALLDEQGNLQLHVENLLKRRRHKCQYQYLMNWRGYPESENPWEFKVPLRKNCPYAVDVLSVTLRVSLHHNAFPTNRCGV